MRLDRLQQVLGELGELVLELDVHPRGQEGDAFEQALDVRVDVGRGAEAEPPGDALVFLAELARRPRGSQFVIVRAAGDPGAYPDCGRRVNLDVGLELDGHGPPPL